MMVAAMVLERSAGCAVLATLSVGTFERGIACVECGGTLVAEREVTKNFGLGVCPTGKYRFDTHERATRGQAAHRRKVSKTCAVYRCSRCRGWHLGNSLGRADVSRRTTR